MLGHRILASVGTVALGAATMVAVSATSAVAVEGRVLAYVANNGSGGVSVINVATNSVSETIAAGSGSSPYDVAVAFDGTRGYVTNSRHGTLTLIHTPTGTVDADVPVGNLPAGVAVSPGGGHAYVTNYADGTLSIVDVALRQTTATIAVGAKPDGIDISPNGRTLYIAHDVPGSGTVSVFDTTTNTVTAQVPTGNTPTALEVTPDGATVVVVNKFSDNVALLDTATSTVTGTIPVSHTPHGISIAPDGKRAVVSNSEGDTVSVIDLVSRTSVATVPVGDRPIGVDYTPDGGRVYVTNYGTGTVSVIDAASLTVSTTIPVGVNPVGIAINTVPPAATKLVASTAYLTVRVLGFTVRGLSARLTESHTGRPLAAKPLVFTTVEGHRLCAATTNADGVGTCDANVPLSVGLTTLLRGYNVSSAATETHQAATAHGPVSLAVTSSTQGERITPAGKPFARSGNVARW